MPSATIISGTQSRRIPLIVSSVKNESGRSTLNTDERRRRSRAVRRSVTICRESVARRALGCVLCPRLPWRETARPRLAQLTTGCAPGRGLGLVTHPVGESDQCIFGDLGAPESSPETLPS